MRALRRKTSDAEEQIYGRADCRILKESEAGLATAELCLEHGISEQTFYRWKAKYGGLKLSEAQRLRPLEEENRKLKQLVAEQALDIVGFKAVGMRTRLRELAADRRRWGYRRLHILLKREGWMVKQQTGLSDLCGRKADWCPGGSGDGRSALKRGYCWLRRFGSTRLGRWAFCRTH
jgi:putative transposase